MVVVFTLQPIYVPKTAKNYLLHTTEVEHEAMSAGGLGLFKDAQLRWYNGRAVFFIFEQVILKNLAWPGTKSGPRGLDTAF